jgi:hypothetical protein
MIYSYKISIYEMAAFDKRFVPREGINKINVKIDKS